MHDFVKKRIADIHIDEVFIARYDRCVRLFQPRHTFALTQRGRVSRLLFGLLLLAVLPLFVWAVATQRIELRKKAATSEPPIVCWNRVFAGAGSLLWPNGCKGSPRTDLVCTQASIPLTNEEINEYQRWVALGSPYIPGCGQITCDTLTTTQRNMFEQCEAAGYPDVCFDRYSGEYQGCDNHFNNTCTQNNTHAQQNILCGSSVPNTPTPTCIPRPACMDPLPGQPLCMTDLPPGGWICPKPTPTPTPGPNCYYQQVQCVQAPCDPILVCPTPTASECSPCGFETMGTDRQCSGGLTCQRFQYGGGCVDDDSGFALCNSPLVKFLCAKPDGSSRCPLTPTPTPFRPYNWCPGPNGTKCEAPSCPRCRDFQRGFCQNNVCITKPTPTPTCIPRLRCMDYPEPGRPRCEPDIPEGGWICPITPTPTPSPTPSPTVTPTPTPIPSQNIEFRVKLAGVTGAEAEGAKVTVKFYLNNGSVRQLSAPLSLTHVANGVYKAGATITNPFPAGTQFRIKVKGEKHVSVEFCKQVGQSNRCDDADYISVPNPVPQTYEFDLTGILLPPGDLPPQDGQADLTDLSRLKPLMSKPCSSLTAAEKLVGDVDYNGCVNVRDVFLMLQTLETRYDE